MAISKPVRHIKPKQSFSDWFKQLAERRETLLFFVWKDLKVQYQNPALGLLWSVFQPLVYFGIILVVMNVAERGSSNVELPFPLYLISGLAIWNFTTSAILGSINGIQANAGIISKAFFPRFYLVLAPIIKSSMDLGLSLCIVFAMALWLGHPISFSMLVALPLSVTTILMVGTGFSAIATSLVVRNRHVRHAIPIIMYAMLFALPVFYSTASLENPILDWVYRLNPIAGAMEILREGLGSNIDFCVAVSWIAQSALWMVIGIVLFRSTEKKVADLV